MADVFLSYAREDRAKAEQIAQALGNAGYDVFWDIEIPPGASWADFLAEKLSQSKVALVLWSSTSTASQWVREEARLARDRGKLIPVMIEECAPPFGFGEIQAANLASWNGEADNVHWKLLVEGIQRTVGSAPTGAAAAPPLRAAAQTGWTPPQQSQHAAGPVTAPASGKRNWMVIGGVALVVVLGLATMLNQGGGGVAPTPAPIVGGGPGPLPPAPTSLSPAVADIVQKARAAQAAGKAAATEAERHAQSGQQAAAAAIRGDAGFATSNGPVGTVAGELVKLQQGQLTPVGIAMSNGAQFAGLMQISQANGGEMLLNGSTVVQGGGWATGLSTMRGGRSTFSGAAFLPNKFGIEAQEEGDGESMNGIGVIRYANGDRYEGQYRGVGQGAQSQYFRNGLGVHYGADERVLNAGRFANDAYVGPS